MNRLSSFKHWPNTLICILSVAALGCSDSKGGDARGSDGGHDDAHGLDSSAGRDGNLGVDGDQSSDSRTKDDSDAGADGGSLGSDSGVNTGGSGGGTLDASLSGDALGGTGGTGVVVETDGGFGTMDEGSSPDLGSADSNDVSIPGGGVDGNLLDADTVGGNDVSISVEVDSGENSDGASNDGAGEWDGGVAVDTGADVGLAIDTASSAGYAVQGDYLRDPDLAKSMLKSLADFRVRARDNVNGGDFTYANVDGTVGSDHRKSFVTQTRDAWAFTRAFMVTGDEAYLEHAAHALEYLYAHGWDSTNGGWYFISDELGASTELWPGYNPNTFKGCFVQHYALLGIGALCDATRDKNTCAWLQKGRRFLDDKMWDAQPSQIGYYDYGSLDLSVVRAKSFTSTVDAMTTHAIQSTLLWPNNDAYRQRLLDLANIVTDRLAANLDLPIAKFGFPEAYNTDWSVDETQTSGYVGHVLKSAWVLARVYLRHPDPRYRQAARKLIYEVLNNGGWDETAGVPYTNTNWASGAQDTTQAECWEIQQAIMSGLSNWYIAENQTDKDTFLRMADRSLAFFVANVVDHVYGGTWKMNEVTGAPKGNSKSNEYNVEYHSTETFYFTYLYGNLLLQRRPVTLYYKIAAAPNQQVVQLNPVSIDDASLQIQSVTLDGVPLATFAGQTREVTLAANQGGKLAVVFGHGP
jgi:mannose/cellobiose epimerase-like protein (N-acyl-D-glucosamine 2-epimerase family)